jgi:hypothetical protein
MRYPIKPLAKWIALCILLLSTHGCSQSTPLEKPILKTAVPISSPATGSAPLTTPIPNKIGLTIEENEIIGQVSIDPLTFRPVHGSQQDIIARHTLEKETSYSLQNGSHIVYTPPGDNSFKAFRTSDNSGIILQKDGITILQTSIGDASPVNPLRGLWVYDEHWVLEVAFVKNIADGDSIHSDVTGQIYRDGVLLNEQLGYEEMFGFQLLGGKPFYFYKKDGEFHLSYNNQDLPVKYDEIPHYYCCSGSELNPISGTNWVVFLGQRDGVWYYSEIGQY